MYLDGSLLATKKCYNTLTTLDVVRTRPDIAATNQRSIKTTKELY